MVKFVVLSERLKVLYGATTESEANEWVNEQVTLYGFDPAEIIIVTILEYGIYHKDNS